MNSLEFIINLLWIISVDTIIGLILFILYKIVDFKISFGTSTNFWSDKEWKNILRRNISTKRILNII